MNYKFKLGDITYDIKDGFEYLRFIFNIDNGYKYIVWDGAGYHKTLKTLTIAEYQLDEYLYTDIFRKPVNRRR